MVYLFVLVIPLESLLKKRNMAALRLLALSFVMAFCIIPQGELIYKIKCGGLRSNIERGSKLNLLARDQINWKSKDVKTQFISHQSPLLLRTTATEF